MILPIVKDRVEENGVCEIPSDITYSYDGAVGKLGALALASFLSCSEAVSDGAFVEFASDDTLDAIDEIYCVTVSADKIRVGFRDARGAVNGAATVALLLRKPQLKCGKITDYPSCGYRSQHLDMARGVPRMDDIKNAIRFMALAKFNRLHLHIMDSYGLCYISDAVPEYKLIPPPGDRPANNYVQCTKDDIREIIRLCDSYAIEIVPEVEAPAHGNALGEAFPEFKCLVENASPWTLCPGNDDIWTVYDKIIGEVVELFPGSEYIHIGSDELEFLDLPDENMFCHWNECPRCAELRKREGLADRQAEFYYVIDKMHEIVKSYGKKTIMWNDQIDVSKDVPVSRDILIEFWRIAHPGRGPHEGCSFKGFLEKGFNVISAPYPFTYVDMDEYMSPEKMKEWTPLHEAEQLPEYADQIVGGEACAWEFGNYQEYPFYKYTIQPCIALVGDKLWGFGKREHNDEFKAALSEFLFGTAEYTGVFDCVGDLIPPRAKGKYTYLDPKDIDRKLASDLAERLGSSCDTSVAKAYSELLATIATLPDTLA